MYIEQAYKGKTDWWRYLVVFLIAVLLNIIASIPISFIAGIQAMNSNADLNEFKNTLNPTSLGLSENAGLAVMIIPFIVVFIGLTLTIKLTHEISFTQVFTSYKRFRWRRFFYAIGAWLVLLIISDFIYFQFHPESYSFHFEGEQFFILMGITFLFIPFQASWEELYFRGNLLQGLGILSRTRWLPLLICTIFFGLMHIANPEVKEYGVYVAMAQYMGFGLLLGIIVLMDGGLEMAFGLHIINNIYASVFVGYSGSVLQTPALFSSTDVNKIYILIAFFIAAFLFLIVSRHMFKWKSFNWLFAPVERPKIGSENL